jgi:cysteine synthase A
MSSLVFIEISRKFYMGFRKLYLPEMMIEKRIKGLASLIGNTPLLAINYSYGGEEKTLYAKAENLNMTGSVKDRMAFHIIKKAYERKKLRQGDPIFEATSGNTGISISALGRALGHDITIFMPNWMSAERKNLIKSFGAKIHLISKEEGGFLECINRAEGAALEAEGFLSSQFSNNDNVEAHYITTGPEIWWQLKSQHLSPDVFVAGVGTGGTIMGISRYLKENNPGLEAHPLEPSNSPTLSTGYKTGKHRIQGISDDFIPSIVKLDQLSKIIAVDDGDAIIMAQRLASDLGIGVGISSGANFLGAVLAQNQLGSEKVVVTLFPDSNKKYLSTDLLAEEPMKNGFISPHIQLLSFKSINRVCKTCYDPKDWDESLYLNQKFVLANH